MIVLSSSEDMVLFHAPKWRTNVEQTNIVGRTNIIEQTDVKGHGVVEHPWALQQWRTHCYNSPGSSNVQKQKNKYFILFLFIFTWHYTWLQQPSSVFKAFSASFYVSVRERKSCLLHTHMHTLTCTCSGEYFRWWYPRAYYRCDGQVARKAWHHNCFLHPCQTRGKRRRS